MDENIISLIAKELNIAISQVKNTLELLEEGATVPFIARYRKERTKGLDEEQIRVIQENYAYQVNLAKRKEEVLARIETLGKLDDEIIKNVNACTKLSQVEDIYRPYKQKKKTRASVAIANGLQPLADTFMSFPRYFKETELENILPNSFLRISKSTIVNIQKIYSLSHSVSSHLITFQNSHKQVYVSRMYYKVLKERRNHL